MPALGFKVRTLATEVEAYPRLASLSRNDLAPSSFV